MNKKVKNYFNRCKIQENHERPYVLLEMAIGNEVKIPITQEILDFVHEVRLQFARQGNPASEKPTVHATIAAMFMLLIPPPLHNYVAREEKGTVNIYETRRRHGGDRFDDHLVGSITEDIRKMYASSQTKEVEPKKVDPDKIDFWNKELDIPKSQFKDLEPPKTDDMKVAHWWIKENKDAIHDVSANARSAKNKDLLPKAVAKIILRGTTNVSLGFKKGSKVGWYEVHNVPIDLPKFKEHAKDSGFHETMHADSLLSYKGWDKILENDKKEGSPNPALDPPEEGHFGISKPKLKTGHRGYIVPGKTEMGEIPSKTFNKLYDENTEFRNHVNRLVYNAIQSYISMVKGSRTKISNDGTVVFAHGVDEDTVNELVQETIKVLMLQTGAVSEENWAQWNGEKKESVDKWLGLKAYSFAKTQVAYLIRARKRTFAGSANTGNEDAEDSFSTIAAKDNKEKVQAASDAAKQIDAALKADPNLFDDPARLKRVRILAQSDGDVADILKARGINIDDEDEEEPDFGKYNSPLVGKRESFKHYVARRINETGVVWGNDKNSANKIKPGDTLKGGIQVSGAPWTAGKGINHKNNDIKVK